MVKFVRRLAFVCLIFSCFCVANAAPAGENAPGYAIVVSKLTNEDASWSKVVSALENQWQSRYQVKKFVWTDNIYDSLTELRSFQPRYVCFVAQSEETNRDFVVSAHRMTRRLDDDPYTDAVWGILTGYEASDALRIIQAPALTVSRAAGGTSIPLEYFDSGIWYDESVQGHFMEKQSGQAPQDRRDGPKDTTRAIAKAIDSAQLVISSGHATEKDWQLGYAYRNGYFTSKGGALIGVEVNKETFPVESKKSKIWLASGNCLIGHVRDRDCMALAMIHSANVDSMVGYIVPTWFGYMGWGIQDYYLEQPGRFTLAEAFFANNQALTWNLEQQVPGLSNNINPLPGSEAQKSKDEVNLPDDVATKLKEALKRDGQFMRGLIFDQNVVALYGDPAWQNALAVQSSGWDQKLESSRQANETRWTLTITPLKGDKSFSVVNGNGSQRGGRPIFALLPQKTGKATLESGAEYNPLITDDFILVPQSAALKFDAPNVIRFKTANP